MRDNWFTDTGSLLGTGCPLPITTPFTRAMASAVGVHDRRLRQLKDLGLIRQVMHGVYAAAQTPDSMAFRAMAIGLVMPREAVVTDRTAAWLHGIPILSRGSHLVAPPLDVCETKDSHLNRPGVSGRRRGLLASDVMTVGGVRVTTPLRTTCDLGRLLWRFDALAALDGGLRIGVPLQALVEETHRFRGFRGVRQLRALTPLADPLAELPGESALRLHWYDAGLPRPELQYEIHDGGEHARFRLDVTLPEIRLAAEYDGQEFHTSPEQRAHDRERRDWITRERGWTIEVFDKDDVYGFNSRIVDKLIEARVRARTSYTRWTA